MTEEELQLFYTRKWEMRKRMNPLLKGSLFGLAIVGPFWGIFLWLWLR